MLTIPDWTQLPSLLSLQKVADILNVHPNTLRKWDEQGKLRAVRLNGRGDFRYPREKIQKIFTAAVQPNPVASPNGNDAIVKILRERLRPEMRSEHWGDGYRSIGHRKYAVGLLRALVEGIKHSFVPLPLAWRANGDDAKRLRFRVAGWHPPGIAIASLALLLVVIVRALSGIEIGVETESTVAQVSAGGRVLGAATEVTTGVLWLGYVTAITSLGFGFIFFLYAIRAYFQIIFVLLSSRPWRNGNGHNDNGSNSLNGNGNNIFRRWFQFGENGHPNGNGRTKGLGTSHSGGNGLNGTLHNGNGFLRRLNAHNGTNGRNGGNGNHANGHNGKNGTNGPSTGLGAGPAGMWQDFTAIDLSHQPFISVHLPFYNERKVANRILTATTSFDYQNYEVIVVDDSTDETRAILQKWARHPKVKVIHRDNREGFKGGALNVALHHTDPNAEFIAVFDADFIPYPDTLTHFVRYFRTASGNGNGHTKGLRASNNGHLNLSASPVAAVQGYQWHVLNRGENWITRAVRAEYAGSYVVERPGGELISSLKQIAGSVFMVRRDLLNRFGWGTSITEDFELTLKLYVAGYKVMYTPYIQGPAECVSSLSRLIKQRMRWAEGHTHNIRKAFWKVILSPRLTGREKNEFLYLAPYYLQAAFFLVGTTAWLVSDLVLHVHLPFWTALWGWSLVFTNLLALPLVNSVGLFLEESERKDYFGIASFILLSYILVPFQAFAALKGLIKPKEGPWFRTPKTGHITDPFVRATFRKWFRTMLPGKKPKRALKTPSAALNRKTSLNSFDGFRIVPRRVQWVGTSLLIFFLALTLVVAGFAPFVPTNPVSAEGDGFRTLAQGGTLSATTAGEMDGEIRNPVSQRYSLGNDQALEYIFHPEPRVRVKLGKREIEMKLLASADLGRVRRTASRKDGMVYSYPEVFPGVDLTYTARRSGLEEQLIIKRPTDFQRINESVQLTGLVLAQVRDAIQLAPTEGGSPIFTFPKPYLYEQAHPEIKNEGVAYRIERTAFGYTLSKILTEGGRQWLADPSRVYPVVLDPTLVQSSPVTSGITEAETDSGSFQRKLVYSSNSSAWYAFHSDGDVVRYSKCLASSNCDADADWAAPVAFGNGGSSEANPSAWFQAAGTGAGKIFVAWITDQPVDLPDRLSFNTIDTASADALGTQCDTANLGTILITTHYAYIAVGNNGDVLVGFHNFSGTDIEADIFEVPTGTCTFTSREASSGLPVGSQTVSVVPFEVATNRIQIIYNDAGGNGDLRQSQFDISTSTWNYADNDVDGANSLNVTTFSAASDGTDIWVLRADSATTTDFFRCAGCTADTAPTWTTTDAVPWSSQANITEVSLSYISTSPANTLAAMILKDTTNEQAYFKTTDADTISWSAETSFNFTAGDNGNLSSVYKVANDTNVGIVIREGVAYSFSTLPEKSLVLLLLAPLLPSALKRLRRRVWKTE